VRSGRWNNARVNPSSVIISSLQYHVAGAAYYAGQLYNGETIPTVDGGATLAVKIAGGKVSINTATVIRANLNASNGVMHVIDGVLVPANFALPTQDIIALAEATPFLSTLVTAVSTAGLVSALQVRGPNHTVATSCCLGRRC
jgi:transforming growth factor-beta-induced protein